MTLRYVIREDDLSGTAVAKLLRLHLAEMHSWSPPGTVHAMPIERLRAADVTFYSAWDGSILASIGALKELDSQHGELKSMRSAPAYRGQRAGEAMLLHLMQEARQRGYSWLGLETGRTEPFMPAQTLYVKHGFAECEGFADYHADEFSICMGRKLRRPASR